ncbi:MAG: hypothetical protein AAF915_15420 [Cyanobacteria bacterium P01_D01_bin.50]
MGTSDQPVRHLDDNIDNTTKPVAPITEEYLDKLYQNALNALGHGEQSKFGIAIKKQIVNKLKKRLKEFNNNYL